MNPYPTERELRVSRYAARLLGDQETAAAKFFAAVQAFKERIGNLDFPLGCPVRGYDMDDITGQVDEWTKPHLRRAVQRKALDAAQSELEDV